MYSGVFIYIIFGGIYIYIRNHHVLRQKGSKMSSRASGEKTKSLRDVQCSKNREWLEWILPNGRCSMC